jgi:autotransporter family porin
VAANGTNLLALASAACSSATPSLLKIEPGTYDLGGSTIAGCPNMDIEGSGQDVTLLASTATVIQGDVSGSGEIRNLTITSTSNVDNAVEIFNGSVSLRNVTIYLNSTAPEGVAGISLDGTGGVLDHVTVNVPNATTSVAGVLCIAAGSVPIADSTILVNGASASGIDVMQGTITVRNSVVQTTGSNPTDVAVNSFGFGTQVVIYGSQLQSTGTNVNPGPSGTPTQAAYTQFSGTVSNGVVCIGSFNASLTALNSSCQGSGASRAFSLS